MKRNSKSKIQNSRIHPHPLPSSKREPGGVAFLWDESFLWGLMAYRALKGLALPFDLIRAEDIRGGALETYKILFVPGGWASNKGKALGDAGMQAIRDFVQNGGSYLGFCGGAGLATLDGIGLLNIKRKPTKERVPSFSGRIYLNIVGHPIWEGISELGIKGQELGEKKGKRIFHAWWPSQFLVENKTIETLATYENALPDSFSSDLNTHDVETSGNWEELEKVYGINLDPKRLLNEPAVIEGNYGNGKVVLSLVHFDTPDDINGHRVLRNLWEYLGGNQKSGKAGKRGSEEEKTCEFTDLRASELFTICSDLISLGERNFLWFWRNSMLLQWRRGVRGLEYCTLYAMVKEIVEIIQERGSAELRKIACELPFHKIRNLLVPFVEKAKRLLILERQAMQKGHITYERCDDPEIRKIRAELFSGSKSHGGEFKKLIDEVDGLLFLLLKKAY